MARTVIVGDVHGMCLELEALLAHVDVTADDHVVSVGDLMDKGPDCAGAVRVLRELREAGVRVTLVRGNHEERHERFRRNEAEAARTGKANPMARLDELRTAADGLTDADIAFLDTAIPVAHLPEHDAVVVHAGILPSHTVLPSSTVGLSGRERKALELVYRVRYVNPEGKMVVLGEETDADHYWADLYDGRFGHVYFGHQPFLDRAEPVEFPHATGLDLGAVYGNVLAAAVLEGKHRARYVTVAARGRFAEPHGAAE